MGTFSCACAAVEWINYMTTKQTKVVRYGRVNLDGSNAIHPLLYYPIWKGGPVTTDTHTCSGWGLSLHSVHISWYPVYFSFGLPHEFFRGSRLSRVAAGGLCGPQMCSADSKKILQSGQKAAVEAYHKIHVSSRETRVR